MKKTMEITTLIGLTEREFDRAREKFLYERFQLEEITRNYEARMRRRNVKRNIMRKLAFATDITADYDLWKRRWAKLNELDKHDERDRMRWHAGMDRQIALGDHWNKMCDERKATEKSA